MAFLPTHNTYPPYFDTYLAPMPDVLPAVLLREQLAQIGLLRQLPATQGDYAYAAGKWSIKQVVGHISDAERVFAYRALCFSRGEQHSLPGFDEDSYVLQAGFERRSLADVCDELVAVRQATIALHHSMSPAQLARIGAANARDVSVDALFYIIPAHFAHHVRVLRNRYGLAL